jgi:hypothetical protein
MNQCRFCKKASIMVKRDDGTPEVIYMIPVDVHQKLISFLDHKPILILVQQDTTLRALREFKDGDWSDPKVRALSVAQFLQRYYRTTFSPDHTIELN